MNNKNLLKISAIFVVLMILCIVNPAGAVEKKDAAGKTSETMVSMEQININKADAKALTTLKGIGKDRALKIIEYREKNGPFQKPEDIMKVKGIGQKIFEKNKDFMTI